MKKVEIDGLQLLGYIMKASEEDKEQEEKVNKNKSSFDNVFKELVSTMAKAASRAFFYETIDTEPNNIHLAANLLPFIEKGLIKAFKNKQGLEVFLRNVGKIK